MSRILRISSTTLLNRNDLMGHAAAQVNDLIESLYQSIIKHRDGTSGQPPPHTAGSIITCNIPGGFRLELQIDIDLEQDFIEEWCKGFGIKVPESRHE